MKKIALMLVLAAAAAVPAGAKGPAQPALLALVSQGRQTYLEKLDPTTLDQRAGRVVPLPAEASFLATSPGHRVVAVATGTTGRVRFVDVATMRILRGGITLYGNPAAALWGPSGLVVLVWGGGFYTMGPRGGHAKWHELTGALVAAAHGPASLVGLVAPQNEIGTARLVVIDTRGNVRTKTLAGVAAGLAETDSSLHMLRSETPGIAISPDGTRALVVPREGAAVEVDLATLRATPHTLVARTLAKSMEGGSRTAVWLGDTVAVAGVDVTTVDDGVRVTPTGLSLIDTRAWTSRRVNGFATSVTAAGSVFLAYGSGWDEQTQTATGDGVAGYDSDGRVRFHLFRGKVVETVAAEGRYAYVPALDRSAWSVVELSSGRILTAGAAAGLQALLGPQ